MNNICKICGANTREMIHVRFDLKYYYCDLCEFVSKDEKSIITAVEELEGYNTHNNSIEDPRYVAYFMKFIENAVLKYCDRNISGLDFGSGPSPVLAMIFERDYNISMDIYDLYYSPNKIYENKKYGIITSTEVVEHLKNPLGYFRLFKVLLEEEGILSIMTLFHSKKEAEFLEWHYIRDMSHISFYTPKTMKIIAEKVGLKVIYSDDNRYTTFRNLS
ncbi:MAG: class I SAM-dependent methyltransferase [Firmicutes bacterium HGW-Firmicutes-1]|jgi:hypothetical protein|nr:MAG: class I SAM-dependent methyltransferase [Firmicutes bacterium HGW-Firmicutes-1]